MRPLLLSRCITYSYTAYISHRVENEKFVDGYNRKKRIGARINNEEEGDQEMKKIDAPFFLFNRGTSQ